MREKKYMLTISVMASNRKDTLPKTLESIRPILENVPSELIVTDTGCDEELLSIIRKYTDKVVKFQWCKDFSKARNVSVDMAQGEWYLYIDDDEWFDDVSPIIEFFNSRESEKYNAFDYLQRNYNNYEGTSWNDIPVGRATRLIEGQKFVDVIHEHFLHNLQPIKMVNAYVHHYGYVYKNTEDKLNHSKRNLELLEKQLAEGNHHLRQYVHMLQEYNGLNQHEKAYETAMQALEKAKSNKENLIKYISGIKTNVLYSLYNMNRNEEVICKAEEYLSEGGLSMSAYCAINGYLAYAHYDMDDADKAIEAIKEYFLLQEFLRKYEMQKVNESVLMIDTAFSSRMLNDLFNIGLMYAIDREDEDSALVIMRNIANITRVYCIDDEAWLQKMLNMMLYSKNIDVYATVLRAFMKDTACAAKICHLLLGIKEKNMSDYMLLTEKLVSVDNNDKKKV